MTQLEEEMKSHNNTKMAYLTASTNLQFQI